jgi:hypothetical protein
LWGIYGKLAKSREREKLIKEAGLKKPPKTAAEYIATLEQCQLPETAARLRPYAAQI